MQYLKYYFTIRDFLFLNSATSSINFEEHIQTHIKPQLVHRFLLEKPADEYIFKFKREYWTDEKISNQCNDDFYFPPYNPDKPNERLTYSELVNQLKTYKPFDLVLVSMTKEEYIAESKAMEDLESFYGCDLSNIDDDEKQELMHKMMNYKYEHIYGKKRD